MSRLPKLVVVTATVDPAKTRHLWETWRQYASQDWACVVVWTGRTVQGDTEPLRGLTRDRVISMNEYGVVPAFNLGVQAAVGMGCDVIACLHDDLSITEYGWDERVLELFAKRPQALLAGFGGAKGLGAEDIYKTPYQAMQLARQDFRSDMLHAEAHGTRTRDTQRVACLDGFSLIGRAQFMAQSFARMKQLGLIHHYYDGLLGTYAAKQGGETWLVPVSCHHAGGMTAVGSEAYQAWAQEKVAGGDAGFWEQAHRIGYEEGRGVLPLRVE